MFIEITLYKNRTVSTSVFESVQQQLVDASCMQHLIPDEMALHVGSGDESLVDVDDMR